jgi:hypothetical protein
MDAYQGKHHDPNEQPLFEEDVFDTDITTKPIDDDEEETSGGIGILGRQRSLTPHQRITAKIAERNPDSGDEESSGSLSDIALVANYVTYAAAYYTMLTEKGRHDADILHKLDGIRAELQKRCIIDVLLPLLAHINPFVQITAAINVLCTVFDGSDQAIRVLNTARRNGRGFLPFLAGFALDTYLHAQLNPVPNKILSEASRLYADISKSIDHLHVNILDNRDIPSPDKILSWDGHEHTGTFISLPNPQKAEKYYAQHIGMNEYQIYRSDRLKSVPKNGELYRVHRDGSLEHARDRNQVFQKAQVRGKI